MPITQDRLTKLRNFGLSEYAARAYLALLDLGTAEARDVSSISKVPQAKIYHVLEQLHEKGLVVILPEFPKKYVPVPFDDYLNRIFEEHANAARQIEEEREELSEMFAVVGDTDVGNRGFFTVIRGRRNVLSKIEELIQDTKRELIMLGTAGTAGRASHMIHELARAKERGVRVRILAPMDGDTLPQLEKVAQHAEVRDRALDEETHSRKVAIVVSDGTRAFLIHFVPDDANLYAGKDIGVFTDQEAMVAAIQAIVDPHWSRAPDLASKRGEIKEGREPTFTRVYVDEAEARRALDRALARGGADVLGVVGHPTDGAPEVAEVLDRVAKAGGRLRALLNVATADIADSVARAVDAAPGCEVRHTPPRFVARQWVLDDREALFSIVGRPGEAGAPQLVVHTNDRAVVASMRSHFESVWPAASTLATRRQELDAFPHLQPDHPGLGVLFNQMQDPVVVCDAGARVLLWNPAAARLFGLAPHDAVGKPLADLVEPADAEPLARALHAAHAAEPGNSARVLVEATCRSAKGSAGARVEWVASPLAEPSAKDRLVLVVGRELGARQPARKG